MDNTVKIPAILDIPEKLYPMIFQFNDFRYFLLEGGRGGGKSQSIARFLLYLAEKYAVRICCGREIQRSIADSVKAIFDDLIRQWNLCFEIKKDRILHKTSGSEIIFKGFREQGQISIKGLEGIDILWIDEAQAIQKSTLDIIIPTIRKPNSRIFFSMNRLTRNDPVYSAFINDKDCLHIKINWYDNKWCSDELKKEAEKCREKAPKDYEIIWEGNPEENGIDYLLSSAKLDKSKKLDVPAFAYKKIKCMSVDLSGAGGDLCIASLVESVSNNQFALTNRADWNNPDTDYTKGKIISLFSEWQPDLLILDADGLGYPIYVSVKKAIPKTIAFHGAAQSKRQNAFNQRADGYLTLQEFINDELLEIPYDDTRAQLESIKRIFKPDGRIIIQDKKELKSQTGESPDKADSLMMNIYALNYYSYLAETSADNDNTVFLDSADYDPYE